VAQHRAVFMTLREPSPKCRCRANGAAGMCGVLRRIDAAHAASLVTWRDGYALVIAIGRSADGLLTRTCVSDSVVSGRRGMLTRVETACGAASRDDPSYLRHALPLLHVRQPLHLPFHPRRTTAILESLETLKIKMDRANCCHGYPYCRS
jgi:hypothetical protein